jgi:hypothetical protein
MRYQLVLQFFGDSLADLDGLALVEERLNATLGDIGDVDGHDFGSGQANIFVLTEDPRGAFALALPVLNECEVLATMRAAFRDIEGENYTVVWPRDFQGSFVVA